jgi:phosphoglycolate phosphatase
LKFENALLDLDGTLVDSADDIIDCLKLAYFREVGKKLAVDKSFIGPPLREIIMNAAPWLGQEQAEAVFKSFRGFYDNSGLEKTVLREGVPETLKKLSEEGIKMFLVTNKPARPTGTILKKLKIDCFHDTISPDKNGGPSMVKADMVRFILDKWGLSKGNTLMVGDSSEDARAARENGLASAILLNGYGNADSIRRSMPEYILDSFAQMQYLMLGD